ncbi:lytic transglycosylase domain-containing protein [Bartonella sp. DGB2]|uniref:lytic transglycosylase domain-containing protein n=1 Tax=Bartonella sp. DGB2 TaxID=3388426 RepID=UPI00398FC73A
MKLQAKPLFIIILIVCLYNIGFTFSAYANVCESEMYATAKHYGVPLGVLYAVGLTETGKKQYLQPYALNIDGRAVYAKSMDEALFLFNNAKKSGAKYIDIGCMQINEFYHGTNFSSIRDMFNPRYNVAYAASFLKKLYVREGSWTMAVARYHAGKENDLAHKRYICQVIRNMIATGFGKWTGKAKIYCQ